ncbi:DsrE family protein [Salmonella enterica subsp. enterica serovar Chandans]|nr:DsrE family protein [Salmonella enterica subsp. enterica serovar Chandans]
MKIIFHVPELSRSIPCLNNVKNYLKLSVQPEDEAIRIVFNAEAVKSLISQEESAVRWLSLCEEYPCIKLLVCRNSLQGYSLSPDTLINKVEVIPAAVVALVEFQKNGWIYLRP